MFVTRIAVGVPSDVMAPTAHCDPADGLWHASDEASLLDFQSAGEAYSVEFRIGKWLGQDLRNSCEFPKTPASVVATVDVKEIKCPITVRLARSSSHS